jgi:dTDP-4-dehydrorhamnose 3,5-epimerase
MIFLKTYINDLYEINPETKGDERGWFKRIFDFKLFSDNIPNFNIQWVQINHSFNSVKNTWRGFHFQSSPFEETKLVFCISGSVLDCVLDLRVESPTYLKIFTLELNSNNGKALLIPKGCAHGYLTLEENTELIYFHDQYYNCELEHGVRFNDKKIYLKLPTKPSVISKKDLNHPNL